MFGCVSGLFGVIAVLDQSEFEPLWKLQVALAKELQPVGKLHSHFEWRSFANDRKVVDLEAFVDGDLIERFLELDEKRQADVCEQAGVDRLAITRLVEDLSRLK